MCKISKEKNLENFSLQQTITCYFINHIFFCPKKLVSFGLKQNHIALKRKKTYDFTTL